MVLLFLHQWMDFMVRNLVEPQLLNEEVTWARYELGEDFFEEYIQFFGQTALEVHQDLVGLLGSKNSPAIASKAHDLKGLCLNLGLEIFGKQLKAVERAAVEQDWALVKGLLAQFPKLREESVAALVEFKLRQSG
ncbi:MAG: hypothetical protein A2600_04420 [Candidatus Lambdaproteobacteria bacterium RIFOXYD1_FULL_56_27]|uniref:HPt domain-containing protein n=1 Tax=Candidatus Lambdaproteobacteria bacterium RIFOXYD2_FULL_56_26 TaxID=1817773 RepID=A0A1F6H3P8_9PROT|nr:MAG: hypothetical protein A2426_13485 [Candidatus Lambdaproteobacteria bacterium RIFOXYC1_FULL_56_13]OGH04998.1 MAG: hypothetical protein A2557_08485 [Candidatus Lambdaproteobacteria bacterium RIFOXYD2_FULL_56_26]OGH09463.1 MAG: hypothetical protein A2600_04420 [Candidatus Lambdaproteobacteria bacterium RIFOXYD1_FULL_56_27]